VQAGKLYGFDYFLMVEVSVFSVTTRVRPVPRTTRFNREVEIRLIADLRIVNARTSAMLATEKGDVSKKWRKMYTSRPSANAPVEPAILDEVQRELCNQLVLKVVDAIFPIRVLRLNNQGIVFLNRGQAAGVKAGDTYDVFREGEALIDPDTGETLGSEETKVARVKVDQVLAKFSKASIVGGRPRKGYVCRPARGPAEFAREAPPPARPRPDRTPPRVAILNPRSGTRVESAPIDILVEVTDDRGIARVTINDAEVEGTGGRYRARMSNPNEGENRIRVDAWDQAGNRGSDTCSFEFVPPPPPDTIAPTVTILAPRSGQSLTSSPVNVVVSAADDQEVTRVVINGKAAQRDAKGHYRVRVVPGPGQNTIRATAEDAAGNQGRAEASFHFDDKAPEVQANASLLVEGTVDDLEATLTINGKQVNFDPATGRYSVRVPPHPEHPDKIIIVATDPYGNATKEVRRVR
jgi:hypothetical protein